MVSKFQNFKQINSYITKNKKINKNNLSPNNYFYS